MKVTVYQGCISNDITIDEKSLRDMTQNEVDMIVEELLQKAKEALIRNEIQILDIIQMFQYDEFKTAPTCDTCGDNATTTVYNL